jgi:hypothetical protein
MSDEPKNKSWARIVVEAPAVRFCVSLLVAAWFVFGSFVTYAPSADATTMQNIYLTRIEDYGSAIAILNVSAILILGAGRKSGRGE